MDYKTLYYGLVHTNSTAITEDNQLKEQLQLTEEALELSEDTLKFYKELAEMNNHLIESLMARVKLQELEEEDSRVYRK